MVKRERESREWVRALFVADERGDGRGCSDAWRRGGDWRAQLVLLRLARIRFEKCGAHVQFLSVSLADLEQQKGKQYTCTLTMTPLFLCEGPARKRRILLPKLVSATSIRPHFTRSTRNARSPTSRQHVKGALSALRCFRCVLRLCRALLEVRARAVAHARRDTRGSVGGAASTESHRPRATQADRRSGKCTAPAKVPYFSSRHFVSLTGFVSQTHYSLSRARHVNLHIETQATPSHASWPRAPPVGGRG
jgi:hypothetical protein